MSSTKKSPHYGALQTVIEDLFEGQPRDYTVRRLDVVIAAEAADLPDDLQEIVLTDTQPGTAYRMNNDSFGAALSIKDLCLIYQKQ